MADFPSSPKPDYPIEETPAAPEVLVSRHRDGSEQRRLKGAGDGPTFSMRFGGSCPITATEMGALTSHYAGEDGELQSFHWTHPERGGSLLVRYVGAPRVNHVAYNAYQVEVKLMVVPA